MSASKWVSFGQQWTASNSAFDCSPESLSYRQVNSWICGHWAPRETNNADLVNEWCQYPQDRPRTIDLIVGASRARNNGRKVSLLSSHFSLCRFGSNVSGRAEMSTVITRSSISFRCNDWMVKDLMRHAYELKIFHSSARRGLLSVYLPTLSLDYTCVWTWNI